VSSSYVAVNLNGGVKDQVKVNELVLLMFPLPYWHVAMAKLYTCCTGHRWRWGALEIGD
jgi:hypothetical protein